MSEKFQYNSVQERSEAANDVADLVNVDVKGRAHIPSGSGSKSGKFLSDHEQNLINEHADLIHEGYAARESENMIENAVGILTEPSDIRDSLYAQGYIDDEEFEDWSDKEIMQFVEDARSEVAKYAASKEKPEDTDGTVEVKNDVDESSEPVEHNPKHRAEFSDTDTPLFDEMKAEQAEANGAAEEGESLEEYEARHEVRQPGRHRRDVSADELEAMLNTAPAAEQSQERSVSADELEAMLNSNVGEGRLVGEFTAAAQAEQDTPTVARSWRQRLRDLASPAGLAAELGRMSGSAREKLGGRKKSGLALGILAVAGFGVGTAVYLANRHNGGGSGGSGGNWINDIMNNIGDAADKAKDAVDGNDGSGGNGNNIDPQTTGPKGVDWSDFSERARKVTSGEGWYNTFKEFSRLIYSDSKIPLLWRGDFFVHVV
jgi:hypothetical protein